jgi:phytoene dehydrogenase-like protein
VFGRTSPFFAGIDLEARGLRWIDAPAPLGHPLDDGTAVMVRGGVERTAARLGDPADADAYRRLLDPLVDDWEALLPDLLAPFHVPLSPLRALHLARFGLVGLRSATSVLRRFRGDRARALLGGVMAHSILGLTEPVSAAAGLVLLAGAHADGWPFPEGGAGRVPDLLATELRALGGSIVFENRVEALADLPPHGVASSMSCPGVWRRSPVMRCRPTTGGGSSATVTEPASSSSISRSKATSRAAPPRLAGGQDGASGWDVQEIARSEGMVARGRSADRPFVLLTQASRFDRSRAPEGRNTVWAYCHVPNGSTDDMTEPILGQIERFAPGFRERILSMVATGPAQLEAYNPNNVGGDIAGGRQDLGQLFTRPTRRFLDPFATPNPSLFICSAATPPGGGVHGMCGYHGARSALRRLSKRRGGTE